MSDRRECVFLIRMWRPGDDAGDGTWRGSIHDVTTGRRRYITGLADASEFITDALHADTFGKEAPSESPP
jgi:hypothetical protein